MELLTAPWGDEAGEFGRVVHARVRGPGSLFRLNIPIRARQKWRRADSAVAERRGAAHRGSVASIRGWLWLPEFRVRIRWIAPCGKRCRPVNWPSCHGINWGSVFEVVDPDQDPKLFGPRVLWNFGTVGEPGGSWTLVDGILTPPPVEPTSIEPTSRRASGLHRQPSGTVLELAGEVWPATSVDRRSILAAPGATEFAWQRLNHHGWSALATWKEPTFETLQSLLDRFGTVLDDLNNRLRQGQVAWPQILLGTDDKKRHLPSAAGITDLDPLVLQGIEPSALRPRSHLNADRPGRLRQRLNYQVNGEARGAGRTRHA